jgi:hypothetical protein
MKYLITLMILIAQPAQAEWTEVSVDIQGNKHFIDMDSIRINGNYRKYWGLVDYSKPQNESSGELSTRKKSEIDCKEEQYRWLSVTAFSEHMENGAVVARLEAIGSWKQIPPSTIIAGILKTICNWKP